MRIRHYEMAKIEHSARFSFFFICCYYQGIILHRSNFLNSYTFALAQILLAKYSEYSVTYILFTLFCPLLPEVRFLL